MSTAVRFAGPRAIACGQVIVESLGRRDESVTGCEGAANGGQDYSMSGLPDLGGKVAVMAGGAGAGRP